MKPNLCKKTLFSTLLLREPHGKESLAFLVKVGNKRWVRKVRNNIRST